MSDSELLLPLIGSERDLFPNAVPGGGIDRDEEVEISVRLRSRSESGVPPAETMGTLNIQTREYFDRQEYERKYGAREDDLEAIRAYAQAHAMREIGSAAGQRLLHFRGSLSDASDAFGTVIQTYNYPGGTYRGRVGALHIPANLVRIVQGVFGLDNRPQALPFIILPQGNGSSLPAQTPNAMGEYYAFPEALSGAGERIGVLEFGGGFVQSDIDKYFGELSLPQRLIATQEVGAKNNPADAAKFVAEVALDIEMAGAMAPRADIVVYFAPATEKGWIDALTTAVHDAENKIGVLSISWGYVEGPPFWTPAATAAVNEILNEAANFGVTVCVSSGDDGSCPDGLGLARVEFPASSPYALSCGGTSFVLAGDRKYEKVWNTRRATPNSGGASGGGLSDFLRKPAWQPEKGLSAVLPPRAEPRFVGRGVPDVAALSDGCYQIFVGGKHVNNVGGTSAASPLWAGLVARLNQGLGKNMGFINPLLYMKPNLQASFNDITEGDNGFNGARGYSASQGWDPCTGWGSPNGTKLLWALQT